jgi:hypothetical protein
MIHYHKIFTLEPLFYINDEGIVCQEVFNDIPQYLGMYKASDLGRIMSLRKGTPLIMSQNLIKNNYLSVGFSVNGFLKVYSVHQLVAMAFLGHTPCGYKVIVDHRKEGDRLDNRLSNIQLITPRGNTSKSIKNAVSKYTGVSWDKTTNKWRSAIHQDGKSIYLGAYSTEEEASDAYQDALRRINLGEKIQQYINPKKTSKYKGVNWDKDKRKWLVRFKSKHIGRFDDEHEAHLAYQKALNEYNLNKGNNEK